MRQVQRNLFLTGPLQGRHDPVGHGAALFAFFAAMAEAERDYIRDKTLEGHETARTKGRAIGCVKVTDHDMLAPSVPGGGRPGTDGPAGNGPSERLLNWEEVPGGAGWPGRQDTSPGS
ncbi:hypothetical protein [Streptomyces sp. NPDC059010]|uniref:hypothetical protein n=1 Tax=Streptomyces sp. NPDC059010 TaxID=3346695 RepID=UPI0036BF9F88